MKMIITPVGASLFANCMEDNRNIRNDFDQIKECPFADWSDYEDYEIANLRQAALDYIEDVGVHACAELQSIHRIHDQLDDELLMQLIASDTIVSVLVADIITNESVRSLLGESIQVEFDRGADVIGGLQVQDNQMFIREGMTNVIRRISELGADRWSHIAINVTGGYKATLPYLTMLAQINQVPLYYTFEETDALIHISGGPFSISVDVGLMERYSNLFAELEAGVYDWTDFERRHADAIAEIRECIHVFDNMAELSPVSRILWKSYQDFFTVELPRGVYYEFDTRERGQIDTAIGELYRKLHTALSPSYLDSSKCFGRIRELGRNHDLNHTGQVPNQDIFIFKSTDAEQIRLLYSFRVNRQEVEAVRIWDALCRDFPHEDYFGEWKIEFNPPPPLDFVTRRFRIPTPVLARRSQNVQIS